ncbi:IS1595 family transposase [Desulfovibrio sp.]
MYERRSRLSSRQQAELIKFFVVGSTARAAGEIVGVHRNTAASYFMRLRRLIAAHLPSYRLSGEIEADESYFGGVRKGKRGRGAAGKIAVFGLLKRNGRVYTAIIPDARTETLLPIIKEQVEPDSIVYTDTYSAYNALDVSEFHHHRINHSQSFAEQGNHINGIENFWNQAKRHLSRFNGIKPEHFYWFLKECEWRFNGGDHKILLTELNYWVKKAKR